MEEITDFETLSQAHQFQVLRYLETTGSDNIQQAIATLKRFNMNASEAINHQYNNQRDQGDAPTTLTRDQEQQLVRYNNHLRDRYLQRASIWYIVKSYCNILKGLARGVTQCLMPKCVKRTVFYSKFQKLYKDNSKVVLYSRGFDDAFRKAAHDQKCVGVIVSADQRESDIVELLSSTHEVTKLLSTRIVTIGIMHDSSQYKKLKIEVESPTMVFAYKSIYDQIKVIHSVPILQITETRIKDAINRYRHQKRSQKNIIIRYNNRILSMYDQGTHYMQQEIPQNNNYQQERLLVQKQKQEYQEASNLRKQSIKKQEQQKLRIQTMIQDRKVRKMSMPEQPTEGQIVTLSFRCPNGSRVQRKFQKNQKVQILYHWVQTNQDIAFQQQPQRNFELLKGYPPQPLREKMNSQIKQIVEEERQIILIRQL